MTDGPLVEPVIVGRHGAAALAAAAAELDPDSLAAITRLRAQFGPELAAAALTQAALRRRGSAKMGPMGAELYWTPDGLEQASRSSVAHWRARRFRDAGVRGVLDLGCGVGADALAFRDAGLEVIAVEIDPVTASFARANLGPEVTVHTGDATDLAAGLLAETGPDWAIYLDPSRRTARGRTWNVADFSPSWDFVAAMVDAGRPICVKLGPGLPKQFIPDGIEACWVADRGDVVELGLWRLSGQPREPRARWQPAAVILPGDHRLVQPETPRQLAVANPGRYLLEPNGAVIRAGLLSEIAPDNDIWLLDKEVAYLASDVPVTTPFAITFEVLEVLDHNLKTLRSWVRSNGIGVLEIKKRALELDPAELRRQLKPSGPNSATLVLARTPVGTRALVCRRLPAA